MMQPHERQCVNTILKQYLPPHGKVFVFGSRARGSYRATSDLDLLIDIGSPLSYQILSQLREAFEESDLHFSVDVVDKQVASESFLQALETVELT